jgi:hypothetical protein
MCQCWPERVVGGSLDGHYSVPYGEDNRLQSRGDSELGEDARDVSVHRSDAHMEPSGNLLVAGPLREGLQDFVLLGVSLVIASRASW